MALSIVIPTPPPRPERAGFTSGHDFIRGTAEDDFLHRPLSSSERRILDQLDAMDVPRADVLDAILRGKLRRELSASEQQALAALLDEPRNGAAPGAENLADALSVLEAAGAPSFGKGPAPSSIDFDGDDRIFGQGGGDYVADLRGNNLVSTEDGDDRILLGRGNDRIFDRGGDNRIDDRGGNNLISTRDGDDTVTTGDGDDIINVFDGRNNVDAGAGDNIVRGGNGFDNITVGVGNDLIEVRNGTAGQFDRFDLPFIGVERRVHNVVQDFGGSDNIRATGSSRKVDSDVKDLVFNGNDLILSDVGGEIFGDDLIAAGGGDNIIIDFGGNDKVSALEGDDIIFTSFVSAGNDDISAGPGNDSINPGAGADVVRGGPGEDFINLENDGDLDRLVYLEDDRTTNPAATDIVLGFDGGLDQIDVSTLGLSQANLLVFNPAIFGISVGDQDVADLLIAWDVAKDGTLNAGDFFTCILADFDGLLLEPSNFVFNVDTIV